MPRKRQAENSKRAASNLELLLAGVEACPHGLALQQQGTVRFANPAYARLLGFDSVEDLIGKSPMSLLRAAQRRLASKVASENGNSRKFARPELDTISFIFHHRGHPVRLEILRDVREQRQLQRQLREAQKLEALGRAVGGVAHDFNNLLTALMLYCDLLRHELPPGGRARRHSEEISLAAQRGAALVRQLLAFARQQVLEPKVLSLSSIVLGMRNLLQRMVGEDVEVITRCSEEMDSVKVDPMQMQQVILNLAVNARDAMPGGGRLLLESALVPARGKGREAGLPSGRWVRLTVADTGCGMSQETLAHVFEPFFTTKEKGKGTGLGLPMVYGVITQSGGKVSIDSRAGEGTRVTVLLPAARAARSRVKTGPARTVPGGSETVLLVEDDPAVRDSAAQALAEAGYQVLAASDGHEAARLAAGHEDGIALLLCDLVLPDLTGTEVARRMRMRNPEIAVLYMSGYGDRARGLQAEEPRALILQKPFTQVLLKRKVRELLDSRSLASSHRGDHAEARAAG